MPKDWGDYEDDDPDETPKGGSAVEVSSPTRLVPVVHQRYSVYYIRHPSIYNQTLYDIEGNPLLDEERQPLNLWTTKMNEYLKTKRIRCIRVPNGQHAFSYFITDPCQRATFNEVCEKGSMISRNPLHVYVDDPRTCLPHE